METFSCRGKRVLFITTKNVDYIRNSQEIDLLREQAVMMDVLASGQKSYPLRMLSIYIRLLFCRMQKYDVVFIGFAPQLVVPLFFWKFQKQQVIIDFFISVYDTFVNDRKKVKSSSVLARLMHWLDQKTVEKAELIIADTRAHAKYFSEEFGAQEKKLNVLYLNADRRIYYPRQVIRPEQWKGKFLVLYFGSVLPLQGVDVVMEAAGKLEDLSDRIRVVVIGPVSKRYAKVERSYIDYIDWLAQEQLAEAIAAADLCLAGHFNGEIAKARRTIPGKAYIYEAMGKSMILGDSEANHERYQEGQPGIYFVPMGDSEALAEKIRQIFYEMQNRSSRASLTEGKEKGSR